MIHRTRHTRRRMPVILLRFPNLPNSAPNPLLADHFRMLTLLLACECNDRVTNTTTQRMCHSFAFKTNKISACCKWRSPQCGELPTSTVSAFPDITLNQEAYLIFVALSRRLHCWPHARLLKIFWQSKKEPSRGEGRCPVVPLVFKTSLGVVRFPEGSTPSLLRQPSDPAAYLQDRRELFRRRIESAEICLKMKHG